MRGRTITVIVTFALLIPALVAGQAPAPPAAGQAPAGAAQGGPGGGRGRGPAGPANQPRPRDDARHKAFLEIARAGNIDLLFVGDSITDWWANPRGQNPATGIDVWNASFGSMKPANFGIAGDTTQGVLYRLQNGEGEGFSPRAVMLRTRPPLVTRRRPSCAVPA